MSWEAWFTLGIVVVMVASLVRDLVAPAGVVLGAVVALLVAGVVEPAQAFSGFSNPAPATVAALYVVAAGIERTGMLHRIVEKIMGGGDGERWSLGRLLIPSAGASGFLNNTPIVAMMVPALSRWSHRTGQSVSPYLMPLSFAVVLGGLVTAIGTSTNIVVSGLLEASGAEPIGFFEIAKIGLPVALVGLVVLLLVAPYLLPERRPASAGIEDVREFVVEMWVDDRGPLDGLTVAEARLRHLTGVFLAQLERGDEVIGAVSPDTLLQGGDLLRFVGNARDVADLHGRTGLTADAQLHAAEIPEGRMAFFEAVVGPASPLVGASLKTIGFRARYQAAVLAIHRAGQRVEAKLGEVRLRNGDTLLLLAPPDFSGHWGGSHDFLVISRFGDFEPHRSGRALSAGLIGLGVVVTAATGLLSIVEASLLGALAVGVLGVLTPDEIRGAIDLDVIVVIAASFGIGAAISESGLAIQIADGIVGVADNWGTPGVLFAIALATVALTEVVTNNAAAVLVFPIAVSAATAVGADPRPFALVVAVMASASFLTPIGYQTNTMVWGPGGYRFGDFARLGAPLAVTSLAVVMVATAAWWPL